MSESAHFDENEFDGNVNLEVLLITFDDLENGYSVEVDIKYPDEIKENIRNFPFRFEKKIRSQDILTDFMNELKPIKNTKNT